MKIFRFLTILIASTCFVVGASVSTAGEVQDEKPKILLLTHSQGFIHGSLPVAERVMKKMAEESGAFEVVSLEGYRQEREAIDLLRIPVKPATQSGESGHPVGAKRRWGFHDVSGGRFESM